MFNIQELEPEAKMKELEKLTQNTAEIGIGDIAAVSDVLASINISDKVEDTKNLTIDQELTESILKTVSNLVLSDLRIAHNEAGTMSASKTGGRYNELSFHISLLALEVKRENYSFR